ncbi:pre-miRNA 5'-monophosphate methyltransferase [Stigmatopora argus]
MATCVNDDADEGPKEPGAAPYGNFINYYRFNPPDNRLGLIPCSLLADLGYNQKQETTLLLDVGCNSGELSIALYKHLVKTPGKANVNMLALDLDETLIQRAQETNPLPGSVTFIPMDMTGNCSPLHEHLAVHGSSRFHLTTCLAVTMWIHLNHGDAGFLRFLSRLAELSRHLLLEVQPWRCYGAAARRLRKLGRSDFDHFKSLKLSGDMIEHAKKHLETHCKMDYVRCLGSTAWHRKLLLFKEK